MSSSRRSKATGAAKYSYDVNLKNQLIAKALGSPHAACTIKSIDTSAAEKVPGLRFEVTTDATANVVQDPALRDGMWGAYDTARLERDTGWHPRPLREAFHDYMDWVAANELAPTPGQA